MNSNTRWSTSGNDVDFPYNSDCGYDGSDCARTTVDGYIQTSTNIASYSDIRVQIDVDTWDLETDEWCKIWYRFDNGAWNEWAKYVDDGSSNGLFYNNQILDVTVPSSTTNTFWLRCGTVGSSDQDRCYYDNVYLRGIYKTTTKAPTTKAPTTKEPTTNAPTTKLPTLLPTANPTHAPTANPTPSPTNIPSKALTPSPTTNPTQNPTSTPTTNPTKSLTPSPISNATQNPTVTPSYNPTFIPSYNPTERPTRNPTYNPAATAIPTLAPTYNPTNLQTTQQAKTEEIDKKKWFEEYLIYLIIIGSILIFIIMILCIVIMCCCIYRSNTENNQKALQHLPSSEIASVSSANLGETMETSEMVEIGDNKNPLYHWLNSINLMKYYNIFYKQGFNEELNLLYEVNEFHLKEMGITKLADRIKIIKEIKLKKENGGFGAPIFNNAVTPIQPINVNMMMLPIQPAISTITVTPYDTSYNEEEADDDEIYITCTNPQNTHENPIVFTVEGSA